MAIRSVRAQINGTWHTLTLNSSTGAYESRITAPGATSYNLSGGYYPSTVEVTNAAGTVVTADSTTMEGLRLFVNERVKPTITITSPTADAFVSNNQQPIVFNVLDEAGGSGIDISTLTANIDGAAETNIAKSEISNGYRCTLTPTTMADGPHTVQINVSDHDGNAATVASVTFTVDTVPPVLNLSSPVEDLITNTAALTVSGTTNDMTSSPVTVKIVHNGTDQGAITVNANGTFSHNLTLTEGNNTIAVTVTDRAGKTTTVNRLTVLDTSVPVITTARLTPNPVDAGQTVVISVVIA